MATKIEISNRIEFSFTLTDPHLVKEWRWGETKMTTPYSTEWKKITVKVIDGESKKSWKFSTYCPISWYITAQEKRQGVIELLMNNIIFPKKIESLKDIAKSRKSINELNDKIKKNYNAETFTYFGK